MAKNENSYSDTITIIHFNDVYNIEPRAQEPVGGAARFATAVRQMSDLDPMVLFSGDALNPSLMSSILKGKQMIPILKGLGVKCAVYGNHDFDFGIDTLSKVARETEFPWLMSNVIDLTTDKPLADGLVTYMLPWKGHKIGLIGLVEEEWIETLATIDPEDLLFMDFVEQGELLAQQLRDEGADYVIALTHMRWPNDTKLAENVEGIDLILAGHDHDYNVKQINGKYVVKSGTDFREMSVITLRFPPPVAAESNGIGSSAVEVKIEKKTMDSSVEEDAEIKAIVEQFMEQMSGKMDTVIGQLEVELDGRFSSIRTSETNLGNFITDIMLEISDADIALLNSGTLRSDTIHTRGEFRIKDLMAILPMIDPLVVIGLTGAQLMEALENGVSKYPALEGRFPQVAGVNFGFDPNKPPGQRVDHRHVKVQGQFIDLNKAYRVITKSYVADGKDGYDVFKDCAVLRDEEESPALTTAVQNHFKSVRILRGEKKCKSPHHQSIISVNRRKSLARQVTLDESYILTPSVSEYSSTPLKTEQHPSPCLTKREDNEADISRTSLRRCSVNAQGLFRAQTLRIRKSSIQTVELEATGAALAPAVEGRIFVVNDKNRASLDEVWELAHAQQSNITGLQQLADMSLELSPTATLI